VSFPKGNDFGPAASGAAPAAGARLAAPWGDLLDHLAGQFPLCERTEDRLSFGWPPEQPEQKVEVSCRRINQLMRVVVTAEVCAADQVSAMAALQIGAHLLFGAMVVDKGVLAVRHVFTQGRFMEIQLHEAVVLLRDNARLVRGRFDQMRTSAAGAAYDDFKY
jgi:hypothetical protein